MMTKRDQQILFWTLALLCVGGMLVLIFSSLPQDTQVMIGGVRIGAVMGALLIVAGALFVLLLVVATILMPLYVVAIHGHLKKLREQLEKMQWYAQKHHEREERKGREG